MSRPVERAVVFGCDGEELLGVLHEPGSQEAGTAPASTGVIIVVGGPQYRVGSHRQFVLMARELAGRGHAVLRFDYRGMGDSDGATRTFEAVSEDIRCAIDVLFAEQPGLTGVVLWGLCDAA